MGREEGRKEGREERYFVLPALRHLGLVALDTPLRIDNPIYAGAAPRELNWATRGCRP